MVLLTRGRSQDRPNSVRKTREITTGCTVAVLNGRHFSAFGAGDEGVVLRVDPEAQNCDVLFSGKSSAVPVALRHLRAKSPSSREGAAGKSVTLVGDAQGVWDDHADAIVDHRLPRTPEGDWDDVADAIVEHRIPRTSEDTVFDVVDTDHNNVIDRNEFREAFKAGIIAEDGNVVAGVSTEGYTQEEVSMVCAAELSGTSEGWPGTGGIEPPTLNTTANVDIPVREEPEGSPASLTGRGSSQATDLQLGTPPGGPAQQPTGLPDVSAAGFADGVAAFNAAAAAAAAGAAAAVSSTGLPNGANAMIGQAVSQHVVHSASDQARILDIQSGYVACGQPGSVIGDLGSAVTFSAAPHLLSMTNGLHIDPNVRLCDTSSISAHSEAPPSMGYSLAATAGYQVAAPTPGWGLETACASTSRTAPAVLSDGVSVGGCVTPFTGPAPTSPHIVQVQSLRHALEECVRAISTCAGIVDSLRSEAVSADLRRRAGLQAGLPKIEESKQAELQMVTIALQKAADLGAQVLISTAPATSPMAAATGPGIVTTARPRTMTRAASCSGLRGRSAATPVNVEVVGQEDLSMSVPDISSAHRARSGSPTSCGFVGAGRRYSLIATPNGKSGPQPLIVLPDEYSGASMAAPSSRHLAGSLAAPSGAAPWPPGMNHEVSSPHRARYGTVTPQRHRSMTPGGATPTAPVPQPHMQPSPLPPGAMAGCWGSAAAPVQRPPALGMMPPGQPPSPSQWMPVDSSMMSVSGSLHGVPGFAGVGGGLPPSTSFGAPGGPPGSLPGGLPGGPQPAGSSQFHWPPASMGQHPIVCGPPASLEVRGPMG